MINAEQLANLKDGDAISYGPYGNVEFVAVVTVNEKGEAYKVPHVAMRDVTGNEKRVFQSLFMKYAVIK